MKWLKWNDKNIEQKIESLRKYIAIIIALMLYEAIVSIITKIPTIQKLLPLT